MCENKEGNSLSILVLGGSQGAKKFTDLIPDTLCYLSKEIKERLKIYQNCVSDDKVLLEKKYREIGVNFDIKPYFSDIGSIMAKADIIISRAGANTIFEICSFGKPFILVPLQNSIDEDQFKNAKFFFDKGACLIFNEATSHPKMMSKMIINLILSKNERTRMANKAREIGKVKSRKVFVKLLDKYLSE